MSTKSQIQALIDANLADASNITATEHRAVENKLLDEFYPTVFSFNETDSSILTLNPTFEGIVRYDLNVCKVGRLITITGIIYRMSGSSTGWFFEITNSEYYGKNNALTAYSGRNFVAENTITNDISTVCEIRSDNKCYVQMTNGYIRVNLQYFATN